MAKKQAGPKKMPATADAKAIRHARIELPDDDYRRLKDAADRYHLSVAGYIRMAVMERIERDEARGPRPGDRLPPADGRRPVL